MEDGEEKRLLLSVRKVRKFFFFLGFYLFMRNRETERYRHRQREPQAPCREPDIGLYPGSRIRFWTEGGAKPLSHQACAAFPGLT